MPKAARPAAPHPPAYLQPRPFSARAKPEAPRAADARSETAAGLGHDFSKIEARARPVESACGGRPLPRRVERKMAEAFGQDFSDVRVHEDGAAAEIGAKAYTRGRDIHFAPGRYRPAHPAGLRLIGHELAHVVQQRAGRVAVAQGAGTPLNADASLESEADRHGHAASRGERIRTGGTTADACRAPASDAVQRQPDDDEKKKKWSPGGGSILTGLLLGGFGRNVWKQWRQHTGAEQPDPGSRGHAINVTKNFPKRTVGYGANFGIRLIHALAGEYGASGIGHFFAQPHIQEHLKKSVFSRSNLALGEAEHKQWKDVRKNAKTMEEKVGGTAGSWLKPYHRAYLQKAANTMTDPRYMKRVMRLILSRGRK